MLADCSELAPAAKGKHPALPGSPAPKPDATPGTPISRLASSSSSSSSTHSSAPSKPSAADEALAKIRDLMWRHVGIMLGGKELSAPIDFLAKMQLPIPAHRVRLDHQRVNLHAHATLMDHSALRREESRV